MAVLLRSPPWGPCGHFCWNFPFSMAYTSPSPAEASVSTQPTLAQPLPVHIYRPCGCPTGGSCLDRRLDKGKVEPRIFASQSPELLTPNRWRCAYKARAPRGLLSDWRACMGKQLLSGTPGRKSKGKHKASLRTPFCNDGACHHQQGHVVLWWPWVPVLRCL